MKSVRWFTQALVVVIALSSAACNRGGKSKGTGQRMPRVTESGGAGNISTDGDLIAGDEEKVIKGNPQNSQQSSQKTEPTKLNSDGTYTIRPLTVTGPGSNNSNQTAATQPLRVSDLVGVDSGGTGSYQAVPASVGQLQASQIVGHQAPEMHSQLPANNLRAGNQGPGWPAGDMPSQVPAYSGLINQQGQAYTDNKHDEIMSILVQKMNQLPPELLSDSQQLAMTVNRINLAVDRQVIALDLDFQFTDKIVSASFSGYLKQNEAATQLIQRSGSEQFLVHVTCADRPTAAEGITCRNAILTIHHLKDGRVCRTIYAVHRWMMDGIGDGHITMSNEEFELSTKIYEEDKALVKAKNQNKKYDKAPVVKNRAYRSFLRVVGNTIHYTRLQNNEYVRNAAGEPTARHPRWPRFNFIGIRSWAVAYGPAFFEIMMGKGKPGHGQVMFDTTRLAGLLTKPRVAGEPTTAPLAIEGDYTDATVDDYNDERYAQAIQNAQLIDNDGRGHLTMELEFRDSKAGNVKTRVNFNSLPMNVLSGAELMRVVP